ncbi:MAG: long-chain fatty acid--CoA ligase [Blastocatellia bacterium]
MAKSVSKTTNKKEQTKTKQINPLTLEAIPLILLQRAKKHPERIALKVKNNGQFQDITWAEYGRKVSQMAAGLLALGLERGEKVAIISANRPEFAYSDLGVMIAGAVTVAIYPSSTPKSIAYILNHCEARFLIVDNQEKIEKILEVIEELKYLEKIVLVDVGEKIKLPKKIKLQFFEDILALGQEHLDTDEELLTQSINKLNLEDTAIIIYTSGTTGQPKGAMLAHKNISFICATMASVATGVQEHETFISFLPLAHVLERLGCLYFSIHNGGTIGFVEKLETVATDILDIRPTILYGVPRFFEKIYNGVMTAVMDGSWIKRNIFLWAVNVGRQVEKRKQKHRKIGIVLQLKYWLAEKLVFEKIRARLGGRVKSIISGGAPLGVNISEFFANVGMPIMEAYGATETSAPATITRPEALRVGTVGTPIPDVEVKIAEDGEILIRGGGVCQGYYKDPEATKQAFIDGWYYSGDIGHFDDEGNLIITDRKKDIIITSGGKNIAPQNIENILKSSPFINNAMVYGDRRKYLTALITLNPETITTYAAKEKIKTSDLATLVKKHQIRMLIEEEIAKKNRELASYERIKKFSILPKDFSIENGELTPTLKVKRREVTQKYQELLDGMYEKEFASITLENK